MHKTLFCYGKKKHETEIVENKKVKWEKTFEKKINKYNINQ